MIVVIRYPEITKNTSTPTNPPVNSELLRWKNITERTATARNPSTSGRYLGTICAPSGADPNRHVTRRRCPRGHGADASGPAPGRASTALVPTRTLTGGLNECAWFKAE